jgi:hypothetical protein
MAGEDLITSLTHARQSQALVRLATTSGPVEGRVWSVDRRHSETVWLVGGTEAVAEDRFVPLRSIVGVTTVPAAA